ncbi:MAG: lytic transglycosylase domain-containing protein [Thermoanaerobaculia bacterium]
MIVALALLLLAGDDPRPSLIDLQLEGRNEAALGAVQEALRVDPETARALGFDHLRGHLLESLGRKREAHEAFAQAMGSSPALAGYSRYRLAVHQYRMGHPEVAAGLLATLLGRGAPPPLIPAASRLLLRCLEAGGDCRLLSNLDSWRLPAHEHRSLLLAKANCDLRSGHRERAIALLLRLLEQQTDDEPARGAAERLALLRRAAPQPPRITLLLGRTFHHHREFQLAIRFLEQSLAPAAPPASEEAAFEDSYALARSYFWRSQYEVAATRFGELAAHRQESEKTAQVLYQQGRAYELNGDWNAASQSFRRSLLADPTGSWASAALLSSLRLEWRAGHEDPALEHYGQLLSRTQWRDLAGRAALFLAASDLVRGRSDRAGTWLGQATRSHGPPALEIAFWRGRLAELRHDPTGAVRHYVKALREDAFHPLSLAARARLAQDALAAAARAEGLRLASSESTSDLCGAWLLLGEDDPRGLEARLHMERRLRRDPTARAFLEMAPVPPAEWPFWEAEVQQPEELLLALGILEQGSSVIQKHFPVSEASLAYTGSRLLAWGGLTRPSLYQAEVLAERIPDKLPEGLLTPGYRSLLYPFPFRSTILREARRFEIDPFLLAALIREESRFDPQAVSSASARGLTQFVLPTAKRLGARLGMERLHALDLHRPEIAIALGAAYLAELADRFENRSHVVAAAYNAGEDQARLWQSYCYSREPEEYFSKVGFTQTRGYIRKVLSGQAHYRALYGKPQAGE